MKDILAWQWREYQRTGEFPPIARVIFLQL
jgi:hypothetical protein